MVPQRRKQQDRASTKRDDTATVVRRRSHRRPRSRLRIAVVVFLVCTVFLRTAIGAGFGNSNSPYAVLGVTRTTPPSEIKKRYRKLCLQYHPDKNVQKSEKQKAFSEKKFKQIQTAYNAINGDGSGGYQQQQQQQPGGFGSSNPYRSDPVAEAFFRAFTNQANGNNNNGNFFFFRPGSGFAAGGRTGPSFGVRTPFGGTTANNGFDNPMGISLKSIYEQTVEVPLEDLYTGVESYRFRLREDLFTRYRAAIRGNLIFSSLYQGFVFVLPMLRFSRFLAAVVGVCVVHSTLPIPDSDASYVHHIRKGARGGETNAKFSESNEIEIVFKVEEAKHPLYRRKGNDLHADLTITSKEARNGCTKRIRSLDPSETAIEVVVPPKKFGYKKQRARDEQQRRQKRKRKSDDSYSSNCYDDTLRIRGKGWPVRNTQGNGDHPDVYLHGDLVVTIEVDQPSSKKKR